MPLADVVVIDVPRVVAPQALPFVVLGPERGGVTVLQTALCSHPYAFCHGDVLHPKDKARRRAHEAYFGPEEDPVNWPDYCAQAQPDRSRGNPERYLDARVFCSPAHEERAIGVKLLYPYVWYSGLWEYLEERVQQGRLAVVHVTRNPLACFTSQLQMRVSRLKQWRVGEPAPRFYAPSVHVDLDEFVPYARQHQADAHRVRETLGAALIEVPYADIVCRFAPSVRRVCQFLELPDCKAARPAIQRLPNRPLRQRISNFDQLKARAPVDIQRHFGFDLF